MTNWYTADTHFGHGNIIDICNRPYGSVEEMDAALIANFCSKVTEEDDLWILGDFAFGRLAKDPDYLADIFGQLPGGRKHLITGNHDHSATRGLQWDSIAPLKELRDGPHKQAHTLCHYPMVTWNHIRRGALQMFGHVHDNWRGARNCVNVGVDVWDYMPVTFEEIAERAATLPLNPLWPEVEPNMEEL